MDNEKPTTIPVIDIQRRETCKTIIIRCCKQKTIHSSQTLEEAEIDLGQLQRELDAEGIAITRNELSECKSMGQLAAIVCAKADEHSSITDNT